jgi:hypothetical protein
MIFYLERQSFSREAVGSDDEETWGDMGDWGDF